MKWLAQTEIQEWALGYLTRRALRIQDTRKPNQILDLLLHLDGVKGASNENRELFKKMKAAWRQKNLRGDTKRKRNISLILSKEAVRALNRLSGDYRLTKTATAEKVLTEALARENAYKAEKREENVYKRRCNILHQKLDQSLNELCMYRLLLDEASVSLHVSEKQRDDSKRAARGRKNEILHDLPSLPVLKKAKKPSRVKTSSKGKARALRSIPEGIPAEN